MEKTINLKELFQSLKKRLFLIFIITVIFTAISGIVSYFFLTPIYQSSTQILVNQTKDKNAIYNPSEVQTNLQLINTYNAMIKSGAILDKVIEKENLSMTSGELNNSISVSNEQDSQIINITVQNEDPQKAEKIANSIATIFQNEIKSIMNVDNITVLTKANVGLLVKPSIVLNMTLALVVGLMVGLGLAFLLDYLDTTIKNDKDVEEHLGLPILGAINIIDTDIDSKNRSSKINNSEIRGESIGS